MSEEVKREVQTWDPVEWLDRIINGEQTYTLQEVLGNSGHYKLVPDNVEVIQKGTPLSQSRLNRMTDGISFSHNVIGAIAAEALRQAGLAHKNRQVDFEKRFLQGEATITGTPGGYFSTTYPFVLVPIPAGTEHTQTNTPHYDVTLCVTAADDIGKVMVLLLIFWRLIQNTEKRKAAERGIEYNPDNLVFCTRKGTYIYPRNFTKMWSENLRSMGIDHKRFHDLRHTVATVMLEDGEAMNTVQEQLGHYDAGFTASRYGHVTAKMRNSAAVKLGERLEKVRNPEAEDEERDTSVKKEDTVIPFQEGHKLKSAACKIK